MDTHGPLDGRRRRPFAAPGVVALVAAALALVLPAAGWALEVLVGLPYGTHTIGHTAVRVRTFDADREVIYDFGRYGKTWGPLRFSGEGILRVWRGPAAVTHYLSKQRSFRDTIGYELRVSEDEERRIYAYYQALLETARWHKPHPHHSRYRLARDYHGVEHQCTSFALDGWKKRTPREGWERVLHPRFNRGQGFTPAMKAYFDAVQRKLKTRETVVPLDVIDAFEAARRRRDPLVLRARQYPCARCEEGPRHPAVRRPPG